MARPPQPRHLNRLSLPRLYRALDAGGLVRRLAELARDEDMDGTGDITSAACVPARRRGSGVIVCRAPGVVAGLAALEEFRAVLAPGCRVVLRARDGARVRAGAAVATIRGPLRQILAFERPALNLLGRLSGIATRTAGFVRALPRGSRAALLDTRKTTPGMRALEKYAVRCGGAWCHRAGLHDAVLVKDNHVATVPPARLGDWARAMAARARRNGSPSFVELEVDSLVQLRSVLMAQAGAPGAERIDVVLLDNMPPPMMRRAVALRDRLAPRVELEASGGVSLATLARIAATGVDRISAGTLTHGSTWLDLALDIDAAGGGGAARG